MFHNFSITYFQKSILRISAFLILNSLTGIYFPAESYARELRIVSLSPSTTEWLAALELGKFVVGVTEQCDTPEDLARLPKVGPFMRTSIEQVLLRKPTDIVAVDGLPASLVRRFESEKIRVHVFKVSRLSDFPAQIVMLGSALGASAKARVWADKFEKAFTPAGSPPAAPPTRINKSVFLVVSVNPLFVATPRSWLSELFENAGYRNAFRRFSGAGADAADFSRISAESALAAGADGWISFYDGAQDLKPQRDKLLGLIRSRSTGLVKVLPASIFMRPGPRLLEANSMLSGAGR